MREKHFRRGRKRTKTKRKLLNGKKKYKIKKETINLNFICLSRMM